MQCLKKLDHYIQGVQGKEGPIGKKGATGAKGDKGDKGDRGATGPVGDKGATGPRGDKGPAGASQGLQGIQGPKGDKGDPGSFQAGTNIGDTLVWNGSAWIPAPKVSHGFSLLDANGVVIGEFDPMHNVVFLEINNTFYTLGVTPNGFVDTGDQLGILPSNNNTTFYYTSADCTGIEYTPGSYAAPEVQWPNFQNSIADITNEVVNNKLIVMAPNNITTVPINSVGGPFGCNSAGSPGMFPINTPVQVFIDSTHKSAVVKDLSIYQTPFSIETN